MAKQKGNPNWGKGVNTAALPIVETRFDRKCRELGLREIQYAQSRALREWVRNHGAYRYVPEWLLRSFGLELTEGGAGGFLHFRLVEKRDLIVRFGQTLKRVASITTS